MKDNVFVTLGWLFALFVLAGHFGLNLACYNRINAIGIPRRVIKAIEVTLLIECLIVAALLAAWFAVAFGRTPPLAISDLSLLPLSYAFICLVALLYFGVPWLIYRPIFGLEWVAAEKSVEVIKVAERSETELAGTRKCRLLSRIPFNQIFQLAIERKGLPVCGLPAELEGLKIAHFADVHLTGHVRPEYYQIVSEEISGWQPDLVFLTGDIVDNPNCIGWLPNCFGSLVAPQGCYFILGNHDTIVPEPQRIRQMMESLGWIDLGSSTREMEINGVSIGLSGNEVPWFGAAPVVNPGERFHILLSHSPDQIAWARRNQIGLMLAGHTHGGQGRLPLIGPLLSPSRYGSRFASGEFCLEPTTLHVTRGLSGTHLLRINCRPEVSLLTLHVPRD